jgi:hypothetical protein
MKEEVSMALHGLEQKHTKLLGVIPIAQQQNHEGTTLMLLSLEVYSDGFILLGRIFSDGDQPYTPGLHYSPDLSNLSVIDDQGQRYQDGRQNCSGIGQEWRFIYAFEPALTPAAHELYVEVPELRWQHFDHPTLGQKELKIQPGPWSFSIALQ